MSRNAAIQSNPSAFGNYIRRVNIARLHLLFGSRYSGLLTINRFSFPSCYQVHHNTKPPKRLTCFSFRVSIPLVWNGVPVRAALS